MPASAPPAIPLGRSLIAGSVAAVWSVSNTIAFAGLIFAGGAAAGLPLGVSTLLLGFALLSAVVAFVSRTPGLAAASFGGTVLIYVAAVQTIDAQVALQGLPEGAVRGGVAVIACGIITLVAGAMLGICGLLRVGSLVRLLPHSVSAGFFCGLGAAFTLAAFGMALGVTPPGKVLGDAGAVARVAMCVGLGLLLIVLPRWTRHWAAMPAVLLGGTLAYHGVRLVLGQSVATGQAAGWLLGPFPQGGAELPPAASFGVFDVDLLLSLVPFIASAVLLSAITVAFLVTGLESVIKRPMDVDREMAVAGMANVAGGAAGGILGGPGLAGTSLIEGLGARNRLAAGISAAAGLGLLALGPAMLGLIPRPVLAALLLSFGIEQMVLRTWRESRRLPWHETAILLMVAGTMVTVGIVEGLGLGLGVALLIFIWTLRKVPVIRSVLRGDEMRSSVTRSGALLRILEREGHRILLFRLQGYMFFLNAQSVQQAFADRAAAGARFVVLDFHHVLGLDSSAVDAFRRLEQDAVVRRVTLVLSGVRPALAEQFAWQGVFRDASWAAVPNADRGLEHAEERLLAELGVAADDRPLNLADFLSSLEEMPELVERLEPFIERVAFAPGEALMQQGQIADDMVFLERGRVAVTLQEQGEAALHLRTLTAGTVVGEIALVRGGHRTASVTAEMPCEGIRLTRAALKRMEATDPVLALVVHRTIMLQMADRLADNTRAVYLALR